MLLGHAQGSKLHEQVGHCLPEVQTKTPSEALSLRPSVGD
jgi:hypothetical protein